MTDQRIAALTDALGVKPPRLAELADGARNRLASRARGLPGADGAGAAAPPAPEPLPPLAPARPTEIRLASGRRLRVALAPVAGRRADLVALRRVSAANDRRAFQAIGRLETSQRALEQKIAELEEQRDLGMAGLLDGLSGLRRRLDQVKGEQTAALARAQQSTRAAVSGQERTLRSEIRAQSAAARVQKATAAVNTLQVAAFGEKGSLFSTTNLFLAGNQLLWSFLEPFLRGLGGAWLAPLGSLAIGGAVIGKVARDNQVVRFLEGETTLQPGIVESQISLLNRIPASLRDEFRRRIDVRVELLDGPFLVPDGEGGARRIDVTAEVRDGVLFVRLEERLQDPARVRFRVDTGFVNV